MSTASLEMSILSPDYPETFSSVIAMQKVVYSGGQDTAWIDDIVFPSADWHS
jgi:hypothetical protein